MLGFTLFAALLLSAHATPSVKALEEAPPGLVLIKGGKTKVGTPVKEVEPLILKFEQMAKPLAGETPRITVDVKDFYLMPTEVTVEQYGAYVRATGTKPPWTWGGEAVDAARKAFLEEQGRLAKEAREKGLKYESKKFEADAWWENNWQDCTWEIPQDRLDRPVVYVNYREAQAYARWAGLRLMTEFEFARAARRDSDRRYTWGDDFDVKACSSILSGTGRTMPVGSYPAGAVEGIFDLCGNVWEWTASPYKKFKGYKPVRVKDGKRVIEAIAPFDANLRVLVGGSFQQNKVGVRVSTRMFAERMQSTDALGFRCAASTRKGLDTAAAVLANDVLYNVLPSDLEFYPEGSTLLQTWQSEPGTKGDGDGAIEGYRVITGYQRMLFAPAKQIDASSVKQLTDTTVSEGPVHLGLISIDHPLMEPALESGSYHVAFRAAGEIEIPDASSEDSDTTDDVPQDETVPFTEAVGFDASQAQFIFYDLKGTPLVAMPAGKLKYDRMKGTSTVRIERWEPPKKVDKDNPPIPMDTLRFTLMVAGKSGSRGFHFDLPLKLEPGSIGDDWK